MRDRRAVMGSRRARSCASPPRRRCSARRRRARPAARLVAQPLDEVAAQPAEPRCSGNVETMISSTRSSWTACIAAVNGSGCAIWPCASIPSPRSSRQRLPQPPLGLRVRAPAPGRSAGEMIRKLAGAAPRALADAVEQRLAEHGLVRDHEHVLGAGARGEVGRRRARRGSPPAALRISSSSCAGASRSVASGCVETMSSSGASIASASLTASTGSVSTTSPSPRCRPRGSASSVRSSRRPAAARRVSS